MSNKYGITPARSAAFLTHLANTHDGAIPAHVLSDLAPHLLSTDIQRLHVLAEAWLQSSDEIANVLRKHGYDVWGRERESADQ